MEIDATSTRDSYVAPLFPQNRFRLHESFLAQFAGKQPKWGPVGYAVFKRTYARELTDSQKKLREKFGLSTDGSEEWWEVCQRSTEEVFSRQRQQLRMLGQHWDATIARRHAEEFYQRHWEGKFTGSGRMLWFLGTEALERKGSAPLFNCAAVSTKFIADDFAEPFCWMMDLLMCGSGVGTDVRGAGKITIQRPKITDELHVVEDSREGWVNALRVLLRGYGHGEPIPKGYDTSPIREAGAPLKSFGGRSGGPEPLRRLLREVEALLAPHVGKVITSSMIADIANMIGVCVVAGGNRRSSEIIIGDIDDNDFISLKDDTALRDIRRRKDAREQQVLQEWAQASRENGIKHAARRILQEHLMAATELTVDQVAVFQKQLSEINAEMSAVVVADNEWSELAADEYSHPLSTHRWASNNSVLSDDYTDFDSIADARDRNGEPGNIWLKRIQTRGRMIDPPMPGNERVMLVNPCSEIGLENHELCNVPETFPSRHDSLEDWKRSLKYAYILGKTISCIPTHDPKANAVMARNHRLGISCAGVAELYERLGAQETRRWLDEGYRFLRDLDDEYSAWMGVGRSVRLTSIKPGGTSPLLWNVEGGMKWPTARHYFRLVRIDRGNPLLELLRESGYRIEPDFYAPNTDVAYFPVKLDGSIRTESEVSIWEKAEVLTMLQTWWSDNMVSVTLSFRPEETPEVRRVLAMFSDRWKTCSFLPLKDAGYIQAPYTPITEAQYAAAAAGLKPVDFSALRGVTHDEGREDRYCDGDVCEIRSNN
jgi:adenosylcobalamin-dependent ribonucleoside-triphosphate reductase